MDHLANQVKFLTARVDPAFSTLLAITYLLDPSPFPGRAERAGGWLQSSTHTV